MEGRDTYRENRCFSYRKPTSLGSPLAPSLRLGVQGFACIRMRALSITVSLAFIILIFEVFIFLLIFNKRE